MKVSTHAVTGASCSSVANSRCGAMAEDKVDRTVRREAKREGHNEQSSMASSNCGKKNLTRDHVMRADFFPICHGKGLESVRVGGRQCTMCANGPLAAQPSHKSMSDPGEDCSIKLMHAFASVHNSRCMHMLLRKGRTQTTLKEHLMKLRVSDGMRTHAQRSLAHDCRGHTEQLQLHDVPEFPRIHGSLEVCDDSLLFPGSNWLHMLLLCRFWYLQKKEDKLDDFLNTRRMLPQGTQVTTATRGDAVCEATCTPILQTWTV